MCVEKPQSLFRSLNTDIIDLLCTDYASVYLCMEDLRCNIMSIVDLYEAPHEITNYASVYLCMEDLR